MSWSSAGESLCPVAQTLAVVGERWTLLLLREMFIGTRRFDEFQAQLDMSPHLLSNRLKDLEREGIVKRVPYQERPARFEYRLTPKGQDLFPVVVALKAFGEKWGEKQSRRSPALAMVHGACGCATGLKLVCTECGESYGPRDTHAALGSGFQSFGYCQRPRSIQRFAALAP